MTFTPAEREEMRHRFQSEKDRMIESTVVMSDDGLQLLDALDATEAAYDSLVVTYNSLLESYERVGERMSDAEIDKTYIRGFEATHKCHVCGQPRTMPSTNLLCSVGHTEWKEMEATRSALDDALARESRLRAALEDCMKCTNETSAECGNCPGSPGDAHEPGCWWPKAEAALATDKEAGT